VTRVVRFAGALMVMNLRAVSASRGLFVMQALFMLINNLAFFTFWWLLMQRLPDIAGWRLRDIELLYGVTCVSVGLVQVFAGGVRHLGRVIEDGELDVLLVQPKPTLLYAVSMRSQASGIGDAVSGCILLGLSGYVTWAAAPRLMLALTASTVVFLAASIMLFSLGFWLSKADTIARHAWEMLVTFAIYPESIFGGAMRVVLFTVLPAGLISHLPVRLVREPSVAVALSVVMAAVTEGALALWIFHRGLRRYASGSRFSTLG
jgi:ABC-2 type transport system permease protein